MPSVYRCVFGLFVPLLLLVAPACSDEVSTGEENAGVNENDGPIGPSCDDGEVSGAQSDIDCGGPNCDPCQAGRNCNFDLDCHSEICDDGICAPGPCEDLECDDGETCYRGACYPECGDDTDCDEDSRCYEGHCAPLDCDSVICEDDEICYLGACYDKCSEDADCAGGDACVDDACVDPCEMVDCGAGATCYRGGCYDVCEDDDDCEDDARCHDGQCVPRDCDGVECLDTESCYQGGCYPNCATDAHCDAGESCLDGSCVDQCEFADCDDGENCYRGTCYDGCAVHDDCGDDERCHENACVPLDCDGVECLDYETCYYGSCHPSCEDQTDCEDHASCEENACVPVCYEEKKADDETCPDLIFETLDAAAIEATSAVLEAEIYELPLSLLTDHGFCWSTEPEPELGSADCQSLGVGTVTGVYDYSVEDELDPGRDYYVRAYAEHGGEVYYANEVEFLTLAPPVVDVEATQGTIAEYVEVTWTGQPGVVEYEVYRDDTEIGTVDAGETIYEDPEAAAPQGIDIPSNVTATDGDYSDIVHVSWQAAAVDDADMHQYAVVAVYPDVSADPSDEAEGYRASSGIDSYEVEIDDSGNWIDVGLTLSYDDTDAPAPAVEAGQALASQGEFADRVELEVFDVESTDGATRSYRVRAVGDGEDGEESDSVTGYRGVGPLAIQWQRSAGETDANYSDITGATTATYDDTGAPADGSPRYYRAVVDADGASPVTTDAVMGFRAALPTVITHPATDITDNSATLHGELTDLGAPEPTAHGFCIDTSPAPELGSALLCEDLGATGSTGTFSWLYGGLNPGTIYYVRAYATTNAGTAYGDDITFPTVPDAPIDLEASDGSFDEYVAVTWSPVDGADEYEVYRDGVLVDTVTSAEYDDYGAGQGSAPGQPSVSATDGTYTDRIEVTWNEPDVDDGETHSYYVIAVNESGESGTSNTDTGYRSGYSVTSYELQIDDEPWEDLGNTTSHQDYDADEPTVEAGDAEASEGTYTDYVLLELSSADAFSGGEHTYRVRAINDTDTGDDGQDDGHVGVGPAEIQWQRSADDTDGNYSDIGGATTSTYQDTDAPADGSDRYFRAVVDADGADPVVTDAVIGFRAALPVVITHPVTDITEDSATLHGEITELGAPEPTAHGFCIDTDPGPELGSAMLCEDLGPTGTEGMFSWFIDILTPGTTYYVRAYATTNAGTAYGADESFITLPEAPINLEASDGTSDDYVAVTWDGVDGADEYEVYRDGTHVATVTSSEYDDYGAGAGSVPGQPSVSATDGTYTDRVEVTWTEPDVDEGQTHSYYVVAVNDSGDSEQSNTDTGYRAARDITSYELRIDGGTWNDVGDTTIYEDFDADEPTLDAGEADASEGVYEDYVALELIGAEASPGDEHTYEVRAINDTGSGDAGQDDGHIGVGPLEIQWQRSADDADADYSDIDGATSATYDDYDAPEDGSGRYYRAVVSAEGAGEAYSVADRGYRAGGTASIQVYLEELGTVDYTVELIGPDGFAEELDGDEYFSAVPAGSYEVVVEDWPVDPYGNDSYIDIDPSDFELDAGDSQVVDIEIRAAYLVVNEDDSGEGSLRFVVDDVNDGTVVKFWYGVSEIGLADTEIAVDKQIDIDGSQYTADPVAVDGGDSTRLFRINSGGVVKMTDMILQNGFGDPGGAARIVDDGQLILGRVSVEDNQSAQAGGAIAVTDQGVLEVYDTRFANNVADGWGSVIDVPQDEDDVVISIRRSLFQNNVAGGDGGAVDTSGTLEISHSTFVGNESEGRGSAVMVFSGDATLEGLTVVDNIIDSWGGGGGGFDDDAAVYVTVHAEATIRGLVAVGNDEADLGGVAENFVSDGYNIIGEVEDEGDFEEASTDLLGVDDAGLGPLADNGGYTETMLPESGPARAMIPADECIDDAQLPWTYDQRDAYRPAGAFCSAGAAEADAVVETFDGADMSRTSFNSTVDSFTSVEGIEWDYYEVMRQEEDEGDPDAIDGTTVVLHGAAGGWIEAENAPGGASSISMLLAPADTGGGQRQVEVFVDGTSVGESPDVSGETDPYLYTIELGTAVTGDFDLRIESSGDQDVAVDNVSWE